MYVMRVSRDVRQAARGLRRRPLFALTAGLSIALAIAGNAAIFSLADALLLRAPAGVAEPGRLVDVGRTDRGAGFDTLSYPNYADLRDHNQVFSALAAYDVEPIPLGLAAGDGAVRVFASAVTGNYFDVLGTRMAIGRGFLAAEDGAGGGAAVAVIGDALWRERFAADAQILGRVVRLNGRAFTVVGVAPPRFGGNTVVAADLWIPAAAAATLRDGDASGLGSRRASWLVGIGRLRPGVTLAQARAAMSALGADLERAHPVENQGRGIAVAPAHRLPGTLHSLVGGFVGLLGLLVLVVLLIACSNVAGMLLARGLERAREVAVRVSLGGSRGRIVTQLLSESASIASLGAAGGVLGALAMTRLLARIQPMLPMPLALDVRVDARVVAVSIAFTLVAALLAGLVPALQAARTDPALALRGAAASPPRSQRRLLRGYVTAQVAMSVLLVVCGLLFARALARAGGVDPGFDASGVALFDLDLRLAGHTAASGPAFADELLARAKQLPGVRSAAFTRVVPLTGSGYGRGALQVPGRAADAEPLDADWNVVAGDYFATLRIPLVRGRAFTAVDRDGAPRVAIVNETLARRAWGKADPLGWTLLQDEGDGTSRPLLVVGVARDGKYRSLGEAPRAFVYVPFAQAYDPRLTLLVRAAPGAKPFADVRTLLRELDPSLPLVDAASLQARTAVGLLPQRLAGALAGGLGIVGALLAAIGIYGVTAYGVAQRRREIGIRVALGAPRAALLRLAAGQSLAVVLTGGALGLIGAATLGRLLAGLLFGIAPWDPAAFGIALLLLATLATAASWLPARRALAASPSAVLRAE